MSLTRLKIEGVSKQYRLGEVGTGSLSHDFNRFWHRIRGKEDPYSLIGEDNDRTKESKSGYVWALRDINFEVQEGEVLGVIGKNGAGKSTLLKLLSKVTGPSKGSIKINGRIGSLLEVGTGMHPELTGRENIFLNGAILGMTKKEITDKFDEIVEFSGIAGYVDTPLKRYSSGMHVRLGFAVAAFLEPEILIIDEVLAVGDAEFQRRAIGKMKEVSQLSGRTVLFVSHNMEAIKNLCTRAILLENGKIVYQGNPQDVVEEYLKNNTQTALSKNWTIENAPGLGIAKAKSISICPEREDQKNIITVKSPLRIDFEFWLNQDNIATNLSMHLFAASGECVFNVISTIPGPSLNKGLHKSFCKIPGDLLNTGSYYITMIVVQDTSTPILLLEHEIVFEVEEERDQMEWHGKFPGFIRPTVEFKISE